MVDDLTPQDPMSAPADPGAASEQKQGFFSTTAGRIVLIGGAVVAFLIVAGIVVFAVTTFLFVDTAMDAMDEAMQTATSQSSTSATGSVEPDAPAVEPEEVPLSAIFTFRDIFDPLLKPPRAEEETYTDIADLEALENMAADTLYLQDVIVEDGVSYAILWYNFMPYQLAEGEVLGDTPWQVLTVYSGSVTMLYGDSQVTLVVGQGISEK